MTLASRTPRLLTVILTSGGIDSACLLALAAPEDTTALFVDYGHLARRPEERAATALATRYGVSLSKLRVGPLPAREGEIPGRNFLLAHLALSVLAGRSGRVLIGIHAGTGYRDCSPEFARLVQASYDFHSDGRVQFAAPFLEQRKRDILSLASDLGVPVQLTYSCERGVEPPCGECLSCRARTGLCEAA